MINAQLSGLLTHYYYFFMTGLFVCLLAFWILNWRGLAGLLSGVNRKTWWVLGGLVLAGLLIRLVAVPHTHHVYFDEFEHVNAAENLLHQGTFCLTTQGGPDRAEVCSSSNWPPAYHYLLSLTMAVFGDREAVAFNFSSVIGALSIGLVFLIAFLLLNDQRAALGSAFLFSLVPVHLKYSGASETGITSLFLVAGVLLSAILYVRRRDLKSLGLLTLSLAFAVYGRPENFILMILVPVFVLVWGERGRLTRGHAVIFLAALTALTVPYFIHLYLGVFVKTPPGWEPGWAERLGNLKGHWADNLLFWCGPRHPFVVTGLVMAGLWRLFRTEKKVLLFSAIWFWSLFLLYSSYHIGAFAYFDGDRYTLNLSMIAAIVAGAGLMEIAAFLKDRKEWLFGAVLILVAMQSADCLARNVNETFSRNVYREYRFILESRGIIPDDVYVLAYNPPSIITTIHKKALSPDAFDEMAEKPASLILFKDYWFGQMSGSGELDRRLTEEYDREVLSAIKLPDGVEYSFIKLTLKPHSHT